MKSDSGHVGQTGSISKSIENQVGNELLGTFPSYVPPGLKYHNLESRYFFLQIHLKPLHTFSRSSNEEVLISQNILYAGNTCGGKCGLNPTPRVKRD